MLETLLTKFGLPRFLVLELFDTYARDKETDGQTGEQTKAMHNAPPLWRWA